LLGSGRHGYIPESIDSDARPAFGPRSYDSERESKCVLPCGPLDLSHSYDMCKAVDRGMVVTNLRVLEKHGGKSGDWSAEV
jgi:hypothetical protein